MATVRNAFTGDTPMTRKLLTLSLLAACMAASTAGAATPMVAKHGVRPVIRLPAHIRLTDRVRPPFRPLRSA